MGFPRCREWVTLGTQRVVYFDLFYYIVPLSLVLGDGLVEDCQEWRDRFGAHMQQKLFPQNMDLKPIRALPKRSKIIKGPKDADR